MSRELFAREALAQIPKILTLQDRNPHSPTYGCFDRNFWHYKIIDFPSGMAAEFAWPLALVYSLSLAGNPYYQEPSVKQWAEAGLLFAARSGHADGSCDDYFPFEKAAGAAAFSLLAALETYVLLDLNEPELLRFFERRADWLANHHESGRLTNHQALIVLCLEKSGRLLQTDRWKNAQADRLRRVLASQDEEGWFPEYEGCDPGYLTLTIGSLAQLYDLSPDPSVKASLERAIRFTAHFVHPDGTFGGEYGSRNTYNFFPHGFELAGRWFPDALAINDRVSVGLSNGLNAAYADDHIIGHHTWSYLVVCQQWVKERPPLHAPAASRTYFPHAGLLIDRRESAALYLALNKGGVFKFFVNNQLAHSDTHLSVVLRDEKARTAVAHLVGKYDVQLGADTIVISGNLAWAKQQQMTTLKLILLRVFMLTFGRFFPDLVRRFLQRLLIVGNERAPFSFTRSLVWNGEHLHVSDELKAASWNDVRSVGIGSAQTSIYVVMSRTWQAGQLQPWLDLTAEMKKLAQGETLKVERTF